MEIVNIVIFVISAISFYSLGLLVFWWTLIGCNVCQELQLDGRFYLDHQKNHWQKDLICQHHLQMRKKEVVS